MERQEPAEPRRGTIQEGAAEGRPPSGDSRPWRTALAVLSAVAAVLSSGAAMLAVYQQNAYHREQIREQRELIHVEVSLELAKQFDSPMLRNARRALARELLAREPGDGLSDHRVLEFFEGLALFVEHQRVDRETAYGNFAYYVKYYWTATEPHVLAFRMREKDEELYQGFQWLHGVLAAKESAQRGIPVVKLSPNWESLQRFLQDEASLP